MGDQPTSQPGRHRGTIDAVVAADLDTRHGQVIDIITTGTQQHQGARGARINSQDHRVSLASMLV
ncbi:hypothetical protein D3C72_2471900 [compost metagenome]